MPFVNIRILKEVLGEDAAEKKAEISRRITEAISDLSGISKESIWVVFEDIPGAEWYVGAVPQNLPEAGQRDTVPAGGPSAVSGEPAGRGPR